MMTYKQALAYIESLKSGGMKLGLARMERMLELCGHPERRLRFVHIAGTNGKGSVSRMIQSILTTAGYRTGLFTSPAVTGIRDTITVDGASIPEREFADITHQLSVIQSRMAGDTASEFELTTALAFLYFARMHTDICVVECGLGGRDDATNVIPPPLAAVITQVSPDHTSILGKTIAKITENKCGIIKPPCSVITSPRQDEDALAVIFENAAEKGLTVRMPLEESSRITGQALVRLEFVYDGMEITLPLTGEFQKGNAITAIEAVRSLEQVGFPVTIDQIKKGLETVAMPCRQEILRTNPLIMIDGAHNPQGVKALAETLSRFSISGLTMVVGMLADKDAVGCMSLLMPYCRRAICCTPDNPRALPAAKLAEIIKVAGPGSDIIIEESPSSALELALARPAQQILIAGSFYLAAVLRPLILKNRGYK